MLKIGSNVGRQTFSLELTDATGALRDVEAIKAAASRVLGHTLGVNRAFYAEVDGDDWVVDGGFAEGTAQLTPGRYPAQTFGEAVMNTYRAGKRIVFYDTRTDPRLSVQERDAHCAIDIIGAVGVPLVKEGHLIAIIAVQTIHPRAWTQEEIEFVDETAERIQAAIHP